MSFNNKASHAGLILFATVTALTLSVVCAVASSASSTKLRMSIGGHQELGSQSSQPKLMSATEMARQLWSSPNNPDRWLYKTDVHALIQVNCHNKGEICYVIDESIDAMSAPSISLQECEPLPPRWRFSYMPIRNRGEVIRLMLEESEVPYELEVLGYSAWSRGGNKEKTPDGKLPVLRNFDGKGNDLGQEQAITRYLANELGYAGTTVTEKGKVDQLYSFWFSTFRNNGVSHDGDHYSVAALKELVESSEPVAKRGSKDRPMYRETYRASVIDTYSRAQRSLMALDYFEAILEKSKSGFLATQKGPSYVDYALFYCLFELAEEDNAGSVWASSLGLPRCRAFLERMEKRPNINRYFKSPRRMPRYAREADGKSTYVFVPGKWSPVRTHVDKEPKLAGADLRGAGR